MLDRVLAVHDRLFAPLIEYAAASQRRYRVVAHHGTIESAGKAR